MKLVFLVVETKKEKWLSELFDTYTKKIGAFVPFEIQKIKSKSAARSDQVDKRNTDDKEILKQIQTNDFILLCDEKGKEHSSMEFSSHLVRALESGKRRVVVIIGGAYGVGDEVKNRADATARVFVTTQATPTRSGQRNSSSSMRAW